MEKASDAFRTISEVANELGVPKHVLRFWESKFPQIKPMKRGGGRRYYRPEDMLLLGGIRKLLHADGYTIKGVQKILREQGVDVVKTSCTRSGAAGKASQSTQEYKKNNNKQLPKRRSNAANASSEQRAVNHVAAGLSRRGDREKIDRMITELEVCRDMLLGSRLRSPSRKQAPTRKTRKVRSA